MGRSREITWLHHLYSKGPLFFNAPLCYLNERRVFQGYARVLCNLNERWAFQGSARQPCYLMKQLRTSHQQTISRNCSALARFFSFFLFSIKHFDWPSAHLHMPEENRSR